MGNDKHNKYLGRFADNGFTLLEALLIMVIIGVLVAIIVPQVMQNLPRYRLKRATRDLISYMQNARLEAIKRNTNVRIIFNIAGDSYQARSSGPDPAWASGDEFDLFGAVNLADYGSGVAFGFGNAVNDWDSNALIGASHQTVLEYNNQGIAVATGSNFLENRDQTICYAVSTSLVGGKKLRFYNGMGGWSD